jgi:hypothetical protein
MIPLAEALTRVPPSWTRLDLAPGDGVAWVDGDALVAIRPSVGLVHAIGEAAFDATAALLVEARRALPDRCELRVGPAAAGIVARTHEITLIGPMLRMTAGAPRLPDPDGLCALGPDDAGAVAAIADPDHDLDPAWPTRPGWLGVRLDGALVAAIGPTGAGPPTWLAPPRLARAVRRTDLGAHLLAAALRRTPDAALDVRLDRRDRVGFAHAAGFVPRGPWEQWWAVRR